MALKEIELAPFDHVHRLEPAISARADRNELNRSMERTMR